MSASLFARIILVSALALVFAYSLNIIRGDFDTFYHLAAGRWFAAEGLFPHGDPFSYTVPGGLWIIHEWLSQLLFFFIFQAAGIWGLILFSAAMAVATYWFVYRLALLWGARPAVAAAFLFPLSALTLELWIPRPQIFSYLFTVLLVWLMERYRRDGSRVWPWSVIVLLVLWANIHSSMILGVGILWGYAILQVLKRFFPQYFGETEYSHRFAYLAVAGTAAIFLNPDTYKAVFYFAYIKETVATLNVTEWAPIQAYLRIPQAKLFLLMMASINAFLILRHRPRRDPAALGLLLGVSALPLLSIRHVAFFPLLAIPLLSAEISRMLPETERFSRFRKRIALAFALAAVTLFVLRAANLPQDPVLRAIVPTGAINFIAEEGLRGPGLNYSHDGGYFLWRLWPQQKTFIDSRSEPYAGEPARDYRTILSLDEGWRELIDEKYGLNYFLLGHDPVLAPVNGPLTFELVSNLGFRLVYWDDAAIILVRDSPENSALIREHEISIVNPFLDPASLPEKIRADAEAEIRKLDARTPSHSLRRYFLRLQSAP